VAQDHDRKLPSSTPSSSPGFEKPHLLATDRHTHTHTHSKTGQDAWRYRVPKMLPPSLAAGGRGD
jgi:hypothetical protein